MVRTHKITDEKAWSVLEQLQSIEMRAEDLRQLLKFSYREIQYARHKGRIVPSRRSQKNYSRYTYREVIKWRIVRFLMDLGYSPQVIYGDADIKKSETPNGLLVDIEALLKGPKKRAKLSRYALWVRPDKERKDPEYMIGSPKDRFDPKHRDEWKCLSFYKVQEQVLNFIRNHAPQLFKSKKAA